MAEETHLLQDLALHLTARGYRLVTAESCTGGLLAAQLTDYAGSSEWFEGAFVTYRPSAKVRMLGVSDKILQRHGVVSEPTVRAMAEGALQHSDAHISVAVSGVAGPAGGEPDIPVGTVWFAWAARLHEQAPINLHTAKYQLSGTRAQVRTSAAEIALLGIWESLEVIESDSALLQDE